MFDSSVMMSKAQNFSKNGSKSNVKKRDREKKDDKYCEHCKIQGHSKDTCFKLHGYPEWYVELMKNKKDGKIGKQVNLVEASSSDQEKNVEAKQEEWKAEFVRQEIAKAMKTTQIGKEGSASFITSDFAGMANYNYHREIRDSWIIDTGASNHICTQHEL